MNCSVYKMVCSKRLCRVLYNIICIVWLGVVCLSCGNFWFVVKMDEDQWMYDSIMSEVVDMDDENEQECGVNEQHVDCSDAFNTSQVTIFIIVIKLIKWMSLWRLKLCGLCCRYLLPKMMFCSELDQLLTKTNLWRWLWGLTQTLVLEKGLHLC